ncbi:ABC transporter substrate-binding protein [Paenactinomyces guangxiensis]|uniref:Sugar ABC transporter substrate-binding protein n=1 Tax=Paenactinomyces guangxiensis TaxID=1490290 RepID=A0A7W1WRF7_9BACL|nr:sugar ABC transporter substrate-binding protein [Paenactinomyces guangxiensis]MBA4494691.1 sugar ABC transporter substrate-binding protein [Paenactinomyces guangxiensis]MBH8591775.1 sugar ABC transporter substrate-binding protein [Paenactinomyces guangxiensis]
MKRVRVWAVILSTLLLVSMVVGCTEPSAKKNGPIELEFWTINLKKNFSDYIQGTIDAYEKEHPGIKIKWVDVPGADVTKKLTTALTSGDVPDVVNETNLGLSVLQNYNAVQPISDIVGKEKLDPYMDGLLESVTIDGKVMAIPWYYAGPPIGLINTELYQKAGLDPNKPTKTWDELFANGKQIHAKLPKVYGSNDIATLQTFITEGLPILSEDRKTAVFNSPEHVAFVEKFVQAYKDGAIAPGAVVKDDRQYQQTIDNQLAAHSGNAQAATLNNIEKNAPSVIPKLKVVPPVTGKAGKLAVKDTQLFLVPKGSKHPKEAADFALYITSPQKQLEFCKLVPIFPSTEETLKDPFFTKVEGNTIKDQARKVMVEAAPNLTVNILGIEKEQELKEFYEEEIRAAMLGKKSAKEALDTAVKHWNQSLAKN